MGTKLHSNEKKWLFRARIIKKRYKFVALIIIIGNNNNKIQHGS